MSDDRPEDLPESLKEKLNLIEQEALKELSSQVLDQKNLEELRIRYLGRHGKLTQILKDIGNLSPQDRPSLGQHANVIKNSLAQKISELSDGLKKSQRENLLKDSHIDLTLPGRPLPQGSFHPLLKTMAD